MGRVEDESRPLLLDTVAFLFWRAEDPRLGARARSVMLESLRRPIYVSVVSAFEISTKSRLGKLIVPTVILHDFVYAVESDGFRVVDLDAATAFRAGQLPGEHRDPFDRLLAAQALSLNAALVTNDPMLTSLGVDVFW
jgi:PIN domain nuclease of toxin-antitoxin system